MNYKLTNEQNCRKKGVGWRGTIICSFVLFSLCYCRKLVETPPPTSSISEANVFSIDATAIAALNNLYIGMNLKGLGNPIQGIASLSLQTGLSSDELSPYSGATGLFYYYQNAITVSQSGSGNIWAPFYNYIFKCNAAIENLTSSQAHELTLVVKKQLLGEAKFLRGYFYFYLVNVFGGVPLCITTNPQVNSLLPRASKESVFQQIISDLKSAEENLSENYLAGDLISTTTERIRPTKWAAKAFLAKAYLYIGDYEKAEIKASEVISNSFLYGPLLSLNNVFIKNSREAIWQLQPTAINFNTVEAQTFVLPSAGPNAINNPVFLSNQLLSSFEPGDQRAVNGNWVNSVTVAGVTYKFPFKYKKNISDPTITSATGTQNMTEYFMMLRVGEQYLIRAEARAQQGKLSSAIDDLDMIRQRANLTLVANINPGINKAALLDKILHEKRVELFTEGANRWFDLKRTGIVDGVMTIVTPQKSSGTILWQSFQQLYPIPASELEKAINLTQNPDY